MPFYGPYDFDNSLGLPSAGEMRLVERFVVKVPLDEDAETLRTRCRPWPASTQGAPPFLVVQGTSDNLSRPWRESACVRRASSAATRLRVGWSGTPRCLGASTRSTPSRRRGPAHVVAGVARLPARTSTPPTARRHLRRRRAQRVSLATGSTAADMLTHTPGSIVPSPDHREPSAVATRHAEPSRPDVVVGMSIGSIVASLLRAGLSTDDLAVWVSGVEPLPAREAARTLIDHISADPLRMTIPRLTGMLGGLRQVMPNARLRIS